MGTMAMERPPMPPDVAAQMGPKGGGPPPFAGVGAQMAQQAQAGNPLKLALDSTNKIWAEVIKAEPRMEPFVTRARTILEQGLEVVSKGGGPPGAPGGAAGPSENAGEVPAGPQPGQMPG